ncbi:DUF4214 domain-containing protein [Undibacterium fentianense]|uniref:DUF4214 domain-containing protein n=1 Tax=Undibacterium fentianense TaxID=2828728 RepID=A0A941IFJ7_9BURK|nr:DUF4214 domain-containing protein [Undibacterium fentianense]MBR7800791.1 DUF4214 domain-containing protein [Undibacterium fentianense]
MAYVYGDGSYFDERTKGFDSNGLSSTFKVQRDMVSFGTLSANDATDWYQLNLDGPGRYTIFLSTDPINNYSNTHLWTENASGILVTITDRNGVPVRGTESSFANLTSDGRISFDYHGDYSRGDFFIKVSNLSYGSTDYVIGLEANSVAGLNVYGSYAHDYLRGSTGDDYIDAYGGSDTIVNGAGNDTINGGTGLDFLIMAGDMSEYRTSGTLSGLVIKDTLGEEGIDHVTQVERLLFDDFALAFDVNGAAGQAYRLYQAAFNRQPDLAGLGYWIEKLDDGMSLSRVAGEFYHSDEFRSLYGNVTSNATFITTLYQNVLHRAPDLGGYDYWNYKLNSGDMSRAEVLMSFSESAENQAQIIGQIQGGMTYIEWGN